MPVEPLGASGEFDLYGDNRLLGNRDHDAIIADFDGK
jgi:hypothetical protein